MLCRAVSAYGLSFRIRRNAKNGTGFGNVLDDRFVGGMGEQGCEEIRDEGDTDHCRIPKSLDGNVRKTEYLDAALFERIKMELEIGPNTNT